MAENSNIYKRIKQFIDHIINRLKTPKVRKELSVFAICLLISLFIWSSIKLSNEIYLTVSHPISYVNMPKNKGIVNKIPKKISLKISGEGLGFIYENIISGKKKPITIDVSKGDTLTDETGYNIILPLMKLFQDIAIQANYTKNLAEIKPDTITLCFETYCRKQVPVLPNISYNLPPQIWLYKDIQTTPDSIYVTGFKSVIDTLSAVYTVKKDFGSLKGVISQNIALATTKEKSITYSADSVLLSIPSKPFTESQITVPIMVPDSDSGFYKTFPSTVSITFLVSLDDYSQINERMFHVSAEIRESSQHMDVILNEIPDYIKVIRIYPEEVEYIIIK